MEKTINKEVMALNIAVPKERTLQKLWKEILQYKFIYILLIPGIIGFILFRYVPLYGLQLAFKDFKANLGIMGSPWVGMEHFSRLFTERVFLLALRNTLIISIYKVLAGAPAAIILALLINELRSRSYKKFLQTIFTFPHFLSWVVISGMCFNFFGGTGIVNNALMSMGFEKQKLLTDPTTFRAFLVLSEIWKEVGWATILYLATIASIDTSIYEAARIDGANRFQCMLHITLPSMSDIIIVMLIISLGNVMQSGFEQVFNLYNASVFDVGDVIDTYVYRISFQQTPNFGFSTAVGFFKGIVNMILLLSANSIAKWFGHSGIV